MCGVLFFLSGCFHMVGFWSPFGGLGLYMIGAMGKGNNCILLVWSLQFLGGVSSAGRHTYLISTRPVCKLV